MAEIGGTTRVVAAVVVFGIIWELVSLVRFSFIPMWRALVAL